MEKIDASGYQRVVLYDGKREHDIAFQGRKIGGSQKADACGGTRYLTSLIATAGRQSWSLKPARATVTPGSADERPSGASDP